MTHEEESSDETVDETDLTEVREAMERSAELQNQFNERYVEEQRPDWFQENFRHTELDNGEVLLLSPKPSSTLPDISVSTWCDDVEKYLFQSSHSPSRVELTLDTGEKFVGEVTESHVRWEQVEGSP